MSKHKSPNQQLFLASFFDRNDCYIEKPVNGFWLIQCWNGGTKKWNVMVYTEESYRKYKTFKDKRPEFQDQDEFISSLSK